MASPNLGLPFMVVGQFNKEITYNELVTMLDVFCQGRVLSDAIATPPASPANGDAYIVAASGTGVWTNMEDWIAIWYTDYGQWLLLEPKYGWEFFVLSEDQTYWFTDTSAGWAAGRRP